MLYLKVLCFFYMPFHFVFWEAKIGMDVHSYFDLIFGVFFQKNDDGYQYFSL